MSFKDKVIYQIYPKSYKDTNNDGIGDIKGIIDKLPYLNNLGIDMIWLNPIYPSPQNDNGYDVSNYIDIDPMFGSMDDFCELIQEGKKFNIDVMMDMVFNHVSTEHEWFKKALDGDEFYKKFFILRDKPTNWESKFVGSAWSKFGNSSKYYLHLFDKTQADLNWLNKNVQKEIFKIVMFWIKKGVKGFRLDVINLIGKDEFLKDSIDCDSKFEYTDKPITHEYLKILNENTFGKEEGIITVGEMSSTTIENSILYTQPDRKELSMVFHFNHLKVDYNNNQKWQLKKFDVKKFISILNSWGERMSEQNGWIALFYNNHDQPRMLNRCINLQYRVEGAKMLAATIHLSRGTPYIYMGEEIGMINPEFNSIDEYVDIESINAFNEMIKNGRPKTEALEIIKARSRDNARTPMQWDASKNAGFSKAKPWLSIGNSYKEINVEKELKGDEIFNFYKKLISLRKKYKIISEGSYVSYEESNSYVYSFIRSFENNELLVINNFRHIKSNIKIDKRFLSGKVLVSNYENIKISNIIELRPYETISIII